MEDSWSFMILSYWSFNNFRIKGVSVPANEQLNVKRSSGPRRLVGESWPKQTQRLLMAKNKKEKRKESIINPHNDKNVWGLATTVQCVCFYLIFIAMESVHTRANRIKKNNHSIGACSSHISYWFSFQPGSITLLTTFFLEALLATMKYKYNCMAYLLTFKWRGHIQKI